MFTRRVAVLAPDFAYLLAKTAAFFLNAPTTRSRRLISALAATPDTGPRPADLERVFADMRMSPIAEDVYPPHPPALYVNLLQLAHRDRLGDQSDWLTWINSAHGYLQEHRRTVSGATDRASITQQILVSHAWHVGLVFEISHMFTEAAHLFSITLEHDPDHAEAHFHLAMAYTAAKNPTAAEQAFRRAIARRPDDPDLHAGYGELMILGGIGDEEGRREAFRYAREKGFAEDLSVLVLSGLVARDTSTVFFDRALALPNGNPDFRTGELRAIALTALDQTSEAIAEMQRARAHYDDDRFQIALYELLRKQNPKAPTASSRYGPRSSSTIPPPLSRGARSG